MNTLRIIVALAAGVLRLELRDKYSLFWMLIMPIAFVGLFGQMFKDEGGDRLLSLSIVDGDKSFLSGKTIEAMEHEDLRIDRLTPAAFDTIPEPRRTLTIPPGFSDSLSSGRRAPVQFKTRGGKGEPNDMAVEVQIYQGIARTLTLLAEIDTGTTTGFDPEGEEFRGRFEEAASRPDLIGLDVRTAGKGKTVPTGFAGSAQSMLVLFLLMNTTISGAVLLTQEKQSRVLARLATLPIPYAGLLAGKILGLLGIAAVQGSVIIIMGRFLGVWWGPSLPALLLLLLCLGLAAAALGIFLGGFLRTPEQASAISWIIPLFLGAIGGCWWPLEVVPSWMQTFGHVSPAAWAMDGLHGLISFGKGAEAVLLPCLVLLGYAVVLTSIGSRLLRPTE